MNQINTIRTLRYSVKRKRLKEIQNNEQFRDMVELGSLLNAIIYAHTNDIQCQLATLQIDHYAPQPQVVAMTAGLLHDAVEISEEIVRRYPQGPATADLRIFVDSFKNYNPPQVLLDPQCIGPFRIYLSETLSELVPEKYAKPVEVLFQETPYPAGVRWLPVAQVVDASEFYDDVKRGKGEDTHRGIKSVIDCIVEEFTMAAEEFIYRTGRDLGLAVIRRSTPKNLGLKP